MARRPGLGIAATKTDLMNWVHEVGLGALGEMLRGKAEAIAGPKGKHRADRTHHHWGPRARCTRRWRSLRAARRARSSPRPWREQFTRPFHSTVTRDFALTLYLRGEGS